MPNALDQIFENLNRWRHLPNYQLERRLDVFLTPYLLPVVSQHVGKPLKKVIVPELPIKREGDRRSRKVDYVLFAADNSEVYFVELKTDARSRNKGQDKYLQDAQSARFRRVLSDLICICCNTDEEQKYGHLLALLKAAGQIDFPSDSHASLYPTKKRGFAFRESDITITAADSIRILYILPNKDSDCDCIDFENFARHIDESAGAVDALVKKYLLSSCQAAGCTPPESFDA